jgi:hypothetical protein
MHLHRQECLCHTFHMSREADHAPSGAQQQARAQPKLEQGS